MAEQGKQRTARTCPFFLLLRKKRSKQSTASHPTPPKTQNTVLLAVFYLVFGGLEALFLGQEGLAQLLHLPLADVRVQLLCGFVSVPVRLEG